MQLYIRMAKCKVLLFLLKDYFTIHIIAVIKIILSERLPLKPTSQSVTWNKQPMLCAVGFDHGLPCHVKNKSWFDKKGLNPHSHAVTNITAWLCEFKPLSNQLLRCRPLRVVRGANLQPYNTVANSGFVITWSSITLRWPANSSKQNIDPNLNSQKTSHKLPSWVPEAWINIQMLSYQYRKFHCGDNMAVRSSYFHNGNFYTGKV